MHPPRMTRRSAAVIAGIVAVLLALACVGVVLYTRGGGPLPGWAGFLGGSEQDPIGASGPAETVLRTLRLAGYEHASVGDEDDAVVLRIQVPSVDTAADIDVAWQAGASALAVAYPDASRYLVQVFEGEQGLVQVAWEGDDARAAVTGADADALMASAELTMLGAEAAGE